MRAFHFLLVCVAAVFAYPFRQQVATNGQDPSIYEVQQVMQQMSFFKNVNLVAQTEFLTIAMNMDTPRGELLSQLDAWAVRNNVQQQWTSFKTGVNAKKDELISSLRTMFSKLPSAFEEIVQSDNNMALSQNQALQRMGGVFAALTQGVGTALNNFVDYFFGNNGQTTGNNGNWIQGQNGNGFPGNNGGFPGNNNQNNNGGISGNGFPYGNGGFPGNNNGNGNGGSFESVNNNDNRNGMSGNGNNGGFQNNNGFLGNNNGGFPGNGNSGNNIGNTGSGQNGNNGVYPVNTNNGFSGGNNGNNNGGFPGDRVNGNGGFSGGSGGNGGFAGSGSNGNNNGGFPGNGVFPSGNGGQGLVGTEQGNSRPGVLSSGPFVQTGFARF